MTNAPDSGRERNASRTIGVGGFVLAGSVFLSWAQVFLIGNLTLLQIFQLGGETRLVWAVVAVGVGIGVAGIALPNRPARFSAVAVATVVLAGFGIYYYLNEITKTDGFVQPGLGMYVGGLGCVLMFVGAVIPVHGVRSTTPSTGTQAAPPGWYPHESKPGWVRWWDGQSYTHEKPAEGLPSPGEEQVSPGVVTTPVAENPSGAPEPASISPSPPRRPSRRIVLVGGGLVAILAGAAVLGWVLAQPSAGSAVVSVPVVTCSTTYGIQPTPKSVPSTIKLREPNSLAGSLSFYEDQDGYLPPVLAPAGWSCAASVGADGTYGIAVFSPGTPNTLNASGPAHGDVQTVISAGSPVCSGCSDDIACSVFTYAALHNPSTAPCPLTSPASESVSYLQGSANTRVGMARIYDPPSVVGSLPQSGGVNPATGIISYAGGITSAGVLSCVLPSSASNLCTEVVNEYLQPKP